MRLIARQLLGGTLALLVACGSKAEKESSPPAAAEVEVKSVEERLFPAATRRLLDLPALALLPADTRALVVVAKPAVLSATLGLSDDDAGAALGRAIVAAVGFDVIHPDSVPELGIAVDEPVALAWPRGSSLPRLLLFSSADADALRALVDAPATARKRPRKRGKRAAPIPSRVFVREGLVALVLGDPDQALLDSLGAVAGPSALTATEQFITAATAVDFGGDFAAYLAPDLGKLRALAIAGDIGEREARAMAAAVVAEPELDQRAATWIAEFAHRLGVDPQQPGPQPRPALMAEILAAPDAVASVLVAVSSLRHRPRDKQLVARQAALRDAAEFGMIGLLSGGTSKAAEKKRAELGEVDGELRKLRRARDGEVDGRVTALVDSLGHIAMFARADVGKVVLRGGLFAERPLGEIVAEAMALWYLASPHSASGTAIAELAGRADKLRADIRVISDRELGSMFGSDFSSGLDDANIYGGLLGDEVGEMQGGFGLGVSGVGPGGGGTGWGTIGSGSYGTIGHGGGGGGTGYGTGGGRGGMRGKGSGKVGPSATAKSAKVSEGKLDRAEIRGYIGRKQSRIDACAGPDFHGKLTVRFIIKSDGWAEDVRASGGDDDDVRGCLEELFTTFQFPAPDGGEVKVSYPVVID